MSDRDRLLGVVVGSVVVLMVLFGGYRMIKGGFDAKNETLAEQNQRLRQAKAANLQARRDEVLVTEYKRKSLSKNPEAAHLAFQHWLEKQVKEVGLREHRFNFDNIPRTNKPVKELSYLVTGIGDINQVTEFLYRVHSVDTLHRVRNIDLQNHKDGIKMTARIDALSMPELKDGEKIAVGTVDESKLTLSLDEYKEKISVRNLFAPANQAPKFKSLRRQTVEVGKNLNHKIEATDPEEHGLIFELDDSAPAWLEISKSGKLSGRPKEVGEHEFKIYVKDKGIPSKESVADFKVRVIAERVAEEKPVERNEIDEAKFAVLTAIVQGANDPLPQMCMYLRDKDESLYLQEQDDIKVGDWRGEVVLVNPDNNTVRLKTEEGEYELRLGEALSEARLLTKVRKDKAAL